MNFSAKIDYHSLLKVWKRERKEKELCKLPENFYLMLSDYVKALIRKKEEGEENLFSHLLSLKIDRVRRIVELLLKCRYEKVLKGVSKEYLCMEEERIHNALSTARQELDSLIEDLIMGRLSKRMLVRMIAQETQIKNDKGKPYGPLKANDIAFLPREIAESFIKKKSAWRMR